MRSIAALGAMIVVAAIVAACGSSSGIPSNAVVEVGQTPITKASFDHWMKIVTASNGGAVQGEAAPKPVVPDPPTFSACIAHLRSTLPKPKKGQSKESDSQLKTQCEQEYKAYKQQALSFLISANWVMGEAKDRKISVSDEAVEKEFVKLKKQQFKTEAEFKKLLASTDQTTSDLLLNLKLHQLSNKIEEQVKQSASTKISQAEAKKYYGEHKSSYHEAFSKAQPAIESQLRQQRQQEALAKFVAAFHKKWTAKTECRSGYLVQDCKGYEEPKPSTSSSTSSTTSTGTSTTSGTKHK